ncbi:MAG: biopolymer transporter ExbB [Marinosulfonomonas sp.]|nr:MAG: biopolymer transporter ExbB [Marinosulfonomonas sp.]
MDQPDREAEPIFTQPFSLIAVMLICLAMVGLGGYVAYPQVAPVFLANPLLNGFIGIVFVIGVIACFYQVFQIINSVGWIEGFAGGRPGQAMVKAPRLLTSLASLLRARGAKMQIGATSSRSILDSVATRIDEVRDITRYIVSLLIFLGLLGTFWGLATTVPAVVETIRSLAPQEGEGAAEVFARLMKGLEAQLGGMGVAFASSLLGLAGSLIVGLLELFANHGQNRFYRELEEWLSTITRLGFSSGESDGESRGDNSASTALLEHFSRQMETLQTLFTQSDVNRSLVDEQLGNLVVSVNGLVTKLDSGGNNDALVNSIGGLVAKLDKGEKSDALKTDVLGRVADGQEKLVTALSERVEEGGAHVDAESRMRLRSIDVQLLRILEEMSSGRQESLADLRTDISALTKAIKATGTTGRRG